MVDKTRLYLSEMGVDIFWFRTKPITNHGSDDNLSIIENVHRLLLLLQPYKATEWVAVLNSSFRTSITGERPRD